MPGCARMHAHVHRDRSVQVRAIANVAAVRSPYVALEAGGLVRQTPAIASAVVCEQHGGERGGPRRARVVRPPHPPYQYIG